MLSFTGHVRTAYCAPRRIFAEDQEHTREGRGYGFGPHLAEFIVHLLYLILLPKNTNDKKKKLPVTGFKTYPWILQEPLGGKGAHKFQRYTKATH